MFLLILIIGALTSFFGILPFLILFHFVILKTNNGFAIKKVIPHLVTTYIFCFFLTAVLSITGVPSFSYLRMDININLIPFVSLFSTIFNILQILYCLFP